VWLAVLVHSRYTRHGCRLQTESVAGGGLPAGSAGGTHAQALKGFQRLAQMCGALAGVAHGEQAFADAFVT
jgi:hypothetical protein